MELIVKEDGIYHNQATDGIERLTEIPPFAIEKLWLRNIPKHPECLDLLVGTKIKSASCCIPGMITLLRIAEVGKCRTKIYCDEDLSYVNGLVGIKISTTISPDYYLNEELMTNPNIKYVGNISVVNLLLIAKKCKYLEISNSWGDDLSSLEEYLVSPECEVTSLYVHGNSNPELILEGQTSLTKFIYWPRSGDGLQRVINIVRNIPDLRFFTPMLDREIIDITPLLRDPNVKSIKIGSEFIVDTNVLKSNETLLRFGSINNIRYVKDVFKRASRLNYRFILEKTRENKKFLKNKRFACTKLAAE